MESGDQSKPHGQPSVLAQTAEWLACFKPAGWLTIPGRQTEAPVFSEWAEREHGPVWVVHRLDRETSGVCLLARTAEAHRKASLWFQKHEVRKAYDFLAVGRPRAPMLKLKVAIEGAPSVTQVEGREAFENCFLGRAVPLTGRRHQIRIHLAGEGHPILGDPTYEGPREIRVGSSPMGVGRVALHAARLELPSKEIFEAPWSEDFSAWVARLRKERSREK
jgi:23S rRNA-/tRNA-specific pseudouridylate synthase